MNRFAKFGLLSAAGLVGIAVIANAHGSSTVSTTSSPSPSASSVLSTDTPDPTDAPTATPTPDSQALTLACQAVGLANRGDYQGAEQHFLGAETASSGDLNATTGYYQLLTDAAKVALDKLDTPESAAADIQTYHDDLKTYASLVDC